jgi:hypothetical protein
MSTPETYPITGINDGIDPQSGATPLRLEVDDWYLSKAEDHVRQVSLFILALRSFQQASVEDKLSYFQIAGESSILPPSVLDQRNTVH